MTHKEQRKTRRSEGAYRLWSVTERERSISKLFCVKNELVLRQSVNKNKKCPLKIKGAKYTVPPYVLLTTDNEVRRYAHRTRLGNGTLLICQHLTASSTDLLFISFI